MATTTEFRTCPTTGLKVDLTAEKLIKANAVVAGGESLQPVLYALAAERLFAPSRILSGRLYYCTSVGGFREHEVPLDETARAGADALTETIGEALRAGFLPAAPREKACRWCDYLSVCGPHEERRIRAKPQSELDPLKRLRDLP